MSATKAYSHKVAEVYENGIIQRRVCYIIQEVNNVFSSDLIPIIKSEHSNGHAKHCARFLILRFTKLKKINVAKITWCKSVKALNYSIKKNLELIQTDIMYREKCEAVFQLIKNINYANN